MKKNDLRKKRYADIRKDLRIRNLIFPTRHNSQFYSNKIQAVKALSELEQIFITSRLDEEDEEVKGEQILEEIELWVERLRYDKDKTRKHPPYKGEFIKLSVSYDEKFRKYLLKSEFVLKESKYHPKRGTIPGRFPNFGDPIIRDIQKGKLYKNFNHARNEIDRLKDRYPQSSIPGDKDTLYIQIYRKSKDNNNVKKYILKILNIEDDVFKIDLVENKYQGQKIERMKFLIYPTIRSQNDEDYTEQ